MAVGTEDTPSGRADDSVDQYSPLPLGYQWPASRLSSRDMYRLCLIRHATKKPITRLLQDAVALLWDATEGERMAADERTRAKLEALCGGNGEANQRTVLEDLCSGNGEANQGKAMDQGNGRGGLPSKSPRATSTGDA